MLPTFLTDVAIDDNNNAPKGLWHPPSPTALTPRKCFNPSALNARTHRAWDRQPRATTVIDGRPRTIWKRFEAGSDQDKENVVEEVVAFEEKQPESDVDLGRSPTKKAVKKICLADRQVVVKGWERRDSGLMHKPPQTVVDVPIIADTLEGVVKNVEEEHEPQSEPIQEVPASSNMVSDEQDEAIIQEPPSSTSQEEQLLQLETLHCAPIEEVIIEQHDINTDTVEDGEHILSLSATQVWTRSKGALRDDTARARGEFSTPAAKAKVAKTSLSPGTELDSLTPSFLKRIFTVLNDNTPNTSRTTGLVGNAKIASPIKNEVQIPSSEKDESIHSPKQLEPEDAERKCDDSPAKVLPAPQTLKPAAFQRLEDHTQVLLDFLNHNELNKAKKAASIARRSSLANRRDSNAIKAALASPSKQPHYVSDEVALSPVKISKVLKEATEEIVLEPADENVSVDDDVEAVVTRPEDGAQESVQEVSTAEARCSRRSTRIPKQATKNIITIIRTDGQDIPVLKDAESRALAVSTRANTRRNKGTSISVPEMLKKLAAIATAEPSVEEQAEDERPSTLRWKEELARYCEIEAREDTTETAGRAEAIVAEAPPLAVQISVQVMKGTPRPRRIVRPAARRTKSVPVVKEQEHNEVGKPATPAIVAAVSDEPVRRTPFVRSRSAPVIAKRKDEQMRPAPPAAAVKDTKIVMTAASTVTSDTTASLAAPTIPTTTATARPRRLPQPVRSRSKTSVMTTATATTVQQRRQR